MDRENQYLCTDSRYAGAAKRLCKRQNIQLKIVAKIQEVHAFLKEKNLIKLALPLDVTSANEIKTLQDEGFSICDCSKELSASIAIKTDREVQKIKRACKIAEQSLLALLPNLKEGITELETTGLLEYYMRKFGAENRAFDTIVAFAENSAVPHHASSSRVLKKGMPVLLDFGAMVDGYTSDMTRSFLYCPQENSFTDFYLKVHKLVYLAHQKAKNAVCVGSLASTIDGLARAVFQEYAINNNMLKKLQKDNNLYTNNLLIKLHDEQKYSKGYSGLEEFFTHSLGHGLGVFIHQTPALSRTSQDVMQANSVFTIEPGLYFEGLFGIRIEDTYLLKDRAKSFMHIQKNMSTIQ